MIQGLLGGDVTAAASDNDGELTLEVELIGDSRTQNALQVANLARGQTQKNHRVILNLPSGLANVLTKIKADAEDLVWVWYHRLPDYFREGKRTGSVQDSFRRCQTFRGSSQQTAQIRIAVMERLSQIDDAITNYCSVGICSRYFDACELYSAPPKSPPTMIRGELYPTAIDHEVLAGDG